MVAPPKMLEVEPGSELDSVLTEAAGQPVILVRGRERYRLEPDLAGDPDASKTTSDDASPHGGPDQARAGMRATSGDWEDVDAERLIADIYRWRQEGTVPSVSP